MQNLPIFDRKTWKRPLFPCRFPLNPFIESAATWTLQVSAQGGSCKKRAPAFEHGYGTSWNQSKKPLDTHFSETSITRETTIINHPFGKGFYHLFMVIWGMVYYCFTHIGILNKLHDSPQFQQNFEKRSDMTNGSFILKLRHSKKHSAYIGSCPWAPMGCLHDARLRRLVRKLSHENRWLIMTGWWFQTWLLFSIVYGIIFPIDELIFFKMVKTTNQMSFPPAIWTFLRCLMKPEGSCGRNQLI